MINIRDISSQMFKQKKADTEFLQNGIYMILYSILIIFFPVLVKPGGSYYFVDGPSHNISDEKYVWLSHKIDTSYFFKDFKDDNEK